MAYRRFVTSQSPSAPPRCSRTSTSMSPSGALTALARTSGGGKSTLCCGIIAGLETP